MHIGEVRSSDGGQLRLLAEGDGYAMVQYPGLKPHVLHLSMWLALPAGDAEAWKAKRNVMMFGENAKTQPSNG